MESTFMNTENSKTDESHMFRLILFDHLHLNNHIKKMASANLSIYCTWENSKSTYENNKFKISAPKSN